MFVFKCFYKVNIYIYLLVYYGEDISSLDDKIHLLLQGELSMDIFL